MNNFNRTKIIATIGPATQSREMIRELMEAGVAVFRLNFSHGSFESYEAIIAAIRELNAELGLHTAILGDLQGPKIRVGAMQDDVRLEAGKHFVLTTKPVEGTVAQASINYQHFAEDVAAGDKVMLDDGKIELEVVESNGKDAVTLKVIYGGALTSNKGVNLPDTTLRMPSMTEKDTKDLEFAIEKDIDWLALSFVRSAADVQHLRSILSYRGSNMKVIAKIEKPQAWADITAIIEAADGIMIARGDLGVEVPMQDVPMIQKEIVNRCIASAKPVIIATQMMESMIENSRPTRAEVTDVANAIFDGADAVMLSGETAVGKYPVKVIEIMQRIIRAVEEQGEIYDRPLLPDPDSETFLSDAICFNASRLSSDVGAKAILGMTRSGYTAFKTSSIRPRAKIFVFSDNPKIVNTLSLVWGVKCFFYDRMVSTDDTVHDVHRILKESGMVAAGDVVINTASMPLHKQGRTNMIKISKID